MTKKIRKPKPEPGGPCIACGAYDGAHDRGCAVAEPKPRKRQEPARFSSGAIMTGGIIATSRKIREDAGAFWYEVILTDGRRMRISVPKD